MGNEDDDFFDDDDDDAFYNNAAVLAQLDQVESQFTNSQHAPTPQPPPPKRLKFDHQTSRSLGTRNDHDPMDYDGPAVYVDESGKYHNYKSPEPLQRQGVSSVTDRGAFKAAVPGRPQPIPPAVRASAVAGKSTHPSSRPTRLQAEPVSETRNLSLGMQAQRNGTATNPAHPAQAAASTHPRDRPITRQERPPNLEPRWGPVPKANQISARRPSRKSIDNNPIPLAKSNEVIYNQHMSLGSAQNDAVVDLNSTSRVPPGARATVKPLFRPTDTQDPTPAPAEFEQRLHELHMSKESELERMRAEMEAVKQSLKEANLERTRLRGEVSIVRSTLSSHQSSSLQQIQTLRQNEQMIKARAEAAEKELERVQREKETTQIFKGLEASARKPPSSARRHQASQLSQTQMPPPSLPFKGKQAPQRKDQGPSFRGFKKAFDVSDFPVPESQRARSSSQKNKTTASLSTQVDPFVDATQAFDAPQDVTVEQSTQLLPSQTGPLEPTDQSSGRKSTDVSQQIAANMLHSFIIDVNPNPTMSQPDLMVALQFILQSEFKDAAHQATFNRLSLDLFNSLGQSMSGECANSKDDDDQLIKLVAGLGGIMLELTQLFYHTRLLDSMSTSVSIMTTLCETTPLFCSLFLQHPELKQGCDIIPLIMRLINEFGRQDEGIEESFRVRLMENLFDLIEILIWNPTEHAVSRLGQLLESEFVFDTLLCPNQPDPFLSRSLGILTLISGESTLLDQIFLVPLRSTQLSDISENSRRSTRRAEHDVSLLTPIIERLVSLMSRSGPIPAKVLRLLTIFGSMNEIGITRITNSPSLIAMLIRTVAHDSDVFWNGDGGIRHRGELPARLDRLELAMELMFQVVFQPGAKTSFMVHLKQASYHLPGIYHEFMVGFGKIAYAELPRTGYLDQQQTYRLELISDLAFEMIESVASPDEVEDMLTCCDDEVNPVVNNNSVEEEEEEGF